MLTLQAIHQLAQQYNLEFRARYGESSADTLEPPKPQSVTLWFRNECVEAWFALMTQLTEVPVSLFGTRQVTGSGATDGRLFPAYAERLAEVNRIRSNIGLGPVYS